MNANIKTDDFLKMLRDLDMVREYAKRIQHIEEKLDLALSAIKDKPNNSKYLTAQQIESEFGIDQRTILNRSNLAQRDNRFIPSLRLQGRRKYFERKVIERILMPSGRR
jgi:hypothetical protein